MDNAANKCKQMQTWQLQLSGRETRDITKIDRNGVEWQMKVIRILFSVNSPQENWSMYRLLLQLVSLMLDRRASRVQDWKTNATRTPVLQTTLEDPDSDPQIAGSRVGFREISPSGITHPIRSMVLVYMLTWMGYIDGTHVTIYGHDMLYWWYISIYCPYYPFIIHIYKYIYMSHIPYYMDPMGMITPSGTPRRSSKSCRVVFTTDKSLDTSPAPRKTNDTTSLLRNISCYSQASWKICWIIEYQPYLVRLVLVICCDDIYNYIIISYCQPH